MKTHRSIIAVVRKTTRYSVIIEPSQRPGLIMRSIILTLLVQSCGAFSVAPDAARSSLASSTGITKLGAATALPLGETVALPQEDDPKVGVLLLNLGGPEKGEDVEGLSIQICC
jgi:hypothetical protein